LADQTVQIENVGEGGVASEATLLLLVKKMEELAKGQGKDAKKAKDAVEKYHKEMKSGVKVIDDNRKALEENTDAVEESTDSMNRFARGALGLAISGLSQMAGSVVGLSRELLVGGTNFADFAQHVPIVGGALAGLVGVLDDQINSFRDMTQVGVDFGGSIFNLRRAATESGLSMENFQRVVSENSQSLALLGGSAGDGARRFRNISGELQRNFGPQLSRLGLTMEETADYTASYLEIQTRLGRAQRMSDQQLAQGSADYAMQLDRLARITGKRRDQIAEELEQQMNDNRIRALVASMGADAGRALQNVTASIENADLREAITELVATGGVPLENELAQSIARMTPEIAQASAALRDGRISEEEYFAVLRRNSGAMEQFLATNGRQAALIEATGNSAYSAAFALAGLSNIGEDFQRVAQDQVNAMENGDRSLMDFGRAITQLRNLIIGKLIDTGLFQEIEKGFSSFTSYLSSPEGIQRIAETVKMFTDWLGGLVADFKDKGIWATITERLGGAINDMIGGLVTKIGIAIVGLFAARALVNAVGSGISRALGGMFGGGGGESRGGGGGRRGGGNAGASLGRNVGGFVGGIAGGAMEGAARGLAAFANPQILIGAGILGAAITVIGAGIAGATWILGKALPTFAEGMESFESIDGAALISAGKGMGAVALGLGAFGVGSAVAGLGNLVGSVADGIVSLFGGQSPLEKLEEFASYNFDEAQIRGNANAMIAFSQAMAAAGAGQAAGGLGALVGGITSGLASFFGGETIPYDDIEEFGSKRFNAAQVEQNARAVAAFATAMAAMGAGQAASGLGNAVGAIGNAISGFFGGDTDLPYDDIIAFGAVSLGDTERIRANAEAMSAFGNALSSIPENVNGTRSGGLMGAISSFFSGDVVMPWDQVRVFGEQRFDVNGVRVNAEAMVAFGNALSSLPEGGIQGTRSGGLLGLVSGFFSGSEEMPWDKLREFGAEPLDPNGNVVANATAMSAFGNALATFNGEAIAEIDLDRDFINRLQDLASITGGGFQLVADGMTAMAGVTGLETNINALNSLDSTVVTSYNEAMESLVETLGELNEVLAETNEGGMFSSGSGVAAGDVLGQIGGSTAGSNQQLQQLNSTMLQVLEVLREQYDVQEQTARGTRRLQGNLLQGGVAS
jgi:hypothetical protein